MNTPRPFHTPLEWLLLLYCAASLVHFAHNAEFLADYPNLPAWLSRAQIYAVWLGITAIGVAGYILCRVGRRRRYSFGVHGGAHGEARRREDTGEAMKKTGASQPASELITNRIAELGDWRGKTLARMRKLIKQADPDVVEEWKWMGTPVWSHDGIICTGESYKSVVKLTFAKGASLADPTRLFNSSLDGNVRRAIDIREGEDVDERAFKALIREAVALNKSKPAKKAKPRKR